MDYFEGDQRHDRRIPCTYDWSTEEVAGRVKDISLGGMRALSPMKIPVGTRFTVAICGCDDLVFCAPMEVVWCRWVSAPNGRVCEVGFRIPPLSMLENVPANSGINRPNAAIHRR